MKKIALWLSALGLVGVSIAIFAAAQEPAPPAFERGNATATTEEQSEALEPDEDGEDFDAELPKQIQVQVEFIELSHEALTKLLFKSKPVSADVTELREQLQEMVEKKEATVLETMIAIAKSGQKATTESVHEFIYPTEYEPPSIVPDSGGAAQSPTHQTPQKTLPPSFPTSFEARKLGSILEIEPTLYNDVRVIDLRLAPEMLWHTGNNSWHKGKDSNGNDFEVSMPDFYVVRLSLSLTCYSGKYHLAGVVSPKDEKGNTDHKRKVMVLVKCDVLTVK